MGKNTEGKRQRLKLKCLVVKLRIVEQQLIKLIVATIRRHVRFALAAGFLLVTQGDMRQLFPAKVLAQRQAAGAQQHRKEQKYGGGLTHG